MRSACAGATEWLAGGELEVLGVEDGLVQQPRDVVVVQGVDHLPSSAPAGDEAELSEYSLLVRDGPRAGARVTQSI
jgi:hypothetical protein